MTIAQIQFGTEWLRLGRRLLSIIEESEARNAHLTRRPYAALLSSPDRAFCVVELNNHICTVEFLDTVRRTYLTCQFTELEPKRLFLSMIAEREFDSATGRVKSLSSYIFKPNGAVSITTEDFSTHQHRTRKTYADASRQWESYPEFGQYEALAALGRVKAEAEE